MKGLTEGELLLKCADEMEAAVRHGRPPLSSWWNASRLGRWWRTWRR